MDGGVRRRETSDPWASTLSSLLQAFAQAIPSAQAIHGPNTT